jgi:Ni,Fe-hydrogenase III large subunit
MIDYVLFGANILIGIVMYFMKMSHDNSKEQIKELKTEVKELRDTAFRKEDFREFKQEIAGMFQELRSEIKGLKNV